MGNLFEKNKSLDFNIYNLIFNRGGTFVRATFVFLFFTMLYLSFGIMSVFAAIGSGGNENAGELLEALEYVKDGGKYFKENVHWVPTRKTLYKV